MKESGLRLAPASLVALLVSLLFITSCGGGPGTSGREGVLADSASVQEDTLASTYPIPPLSELIERLASSGVGYVIDVGNAPSRVDQYLTSTSRAMNLGVYGADLSYASTYGIKGDVSRYLKVVRDLAKEMNVRTSLLEDLAAMDENHYANKDTMQNMATKAIFEVYAAFCSSGQQEEAVLFLAGGWLEAVYIGSYIATLSQTNSEVVELLLRQKNTYSTITALVKRYKKSDEGVLLAGLLESLEKPYAALSAAPDSEAMLTLTEAFESVRAQMIGQKTPGL